MTTEQFAGVRRLLVIGHVTRDELVDRAQAEAGVRLGGAASYAAVAAARLGVATCLVTVAPSEDPLLAPLRAQAGVDLRCAPSDVMTTFALDYAGPRRTLALVRRARSIVADDVPASLRHRLGDVAGVVAYLGP